MNIGLTVEFWEVSTGNSPVVDYIESLPKKPREKVYWVIKLLRRRGAALVRTKLMRKLRGYDLYELIIFFQGVFYRILLVIVETKACLLHMFKKKSNRTPIKEIGIAQKRRELYLALLDITN